MYFWERFNPLKTGGQNDSINRRKNRPIIMLGGVAVLGIALLLISGLFSAPKISSPREVVPEKDAAGVETNTASSAYPSLVESEKTIEARLEDVLGQISGTGQVSVRVTLGSGPNYEYIMNHNEAKKTIQEQDQAGGSRVTTEINDDGQLVLVHLDQYGSEEPVIERELRPQVDGVLVVAEGAKSAYIREQLTKAVVTVLHIPAYKVSVLPKGEGE